MSSGVDNNRPIDQVRVPVETTAAQVVAKQSVNQVSDTLVSGKESSVLTTVGQKISAVWNWIRETVTSIFKSIFCCFFSKKEETTEKKPVETTTPTKVAKVDPKLKLAADKALIEKLHTDFIAKRDAWWADTVGVEDCFTPWWQDTFDALPKEIQERIIHEATRRYAIENKKLEGADVTQYITDHIGNANFRENSLEFLRNLAPEEKVYPFDDNQIPAMLKQIIADIDTEMNPAKVDELAANK